MTLPDRYSDHDTARILERAASLQDAFDGHEGRTSLAEIQRAAAEVGIDPSHVAAAAREVAGARRGAASGVPMRITCERCVDGHLDLTGVSETIDAVRTVLGAHGDVSPVLDTIEWRGGTALGATIVSVTPRAGGTRLLITATRVDHALAVILGSIGVGTLAAFGGFVLALTAGVGMLAASAIIAASALVGTLASARLFWSAALRRWRRCVEDALETIADRAASLAGGPEPGAAGAQPATIPPHASRAVVSHSLNSRPTGMP